MTTQGLSSDSDSILKLLENIYSHKNLDEILQGVTDGITVQDVFGNLVYANKAAAKILNYESIEQLLNTPPMQIMENFELFDEQGQPFLLASLPGRRALLGETPGSVIVKWCRKDTNDYHWAEIKSTPIFQDGKVILAVNIFHDLTSNRELTQSRDKFFKDHKFIKQVADTSPGMIAVYNIKTGEYVYVNKAIRKILGYEPEDFLNGGLVFVSGLVHQDDIQPIMEKNGAALAQANSENNILPDNESIVNFEYRLKHKNGSYRWLHSDGSVFSRDQDGKVEYVLNISMDITARKDAEEKLFNLTKQLEGEMLKTSSQLSAIIDHSFDAIFTKNLNGKITSWNMGAERVYGYPPEEAIGEHVSMLTPTDKIAELPELFNKVYRGEYIDQYETIRVRKDGRKIDVSLTISPIKDANGQVIGASTIARDITDRKLAEEKIRHNYYFDSLTDLPNRTWFNEQLAKRVTEDSNFAILHMDLDRFKLVNESFGHPAGDLLLKEVGLRIQNCLGKNSELARVGGDEFVIVCNRPVDESEVRSLANDILKDFKRSFKLTGTELYISPSVGISFFPKDSKKPAELVQCAEIALYHAKEQGKNNYQFYNEDMSIMAGYDVNLESTLRQAIENDQLTVHYQPQVNLLNGEIMGIEALVRIQDPHLNLTLPDKFIPLAEVTGLIEPLGESVLKMACLQNKEWNDNGYPNLVMAVNISSRQFKQKDFINMVERTIKSSGINPVNLEMELTERVLLESSPEILKNMKTMAQWGIKFSLDDFSMGYSSLNYIQKFPLHVLKIDRAFLQGVPKNKINRAIAQSIINLGHNLGMMVVAEGVENVEQLKFLSEHNCDKVQGYLFNSPIPGDSITGILGDKRYADIINKIRNPMLPLSFVSV